jgi:hypothetical protein
MFTPAIMPVTAGKKTAKTVQKSSDFDSGTPHNSMELSSSGFPNTRDKRDMAMAAMTKYCDRTAIFADIKARIPIIVVIISPTTVSLRLEKTILILSAKPIV